MSYKSDFSSDLGWSAIDASVRLNNNSGKAFLNYLKSNGVDTIIRYYASTERPKTLTPQEAIFLSDHGFAILPVFQDRARKPADFSTKIGKANAVSAMNFAKKVGQPANKGSTILFAADWDFNAHEIDGPILDYFKAVRATIGDAFRIGAYGCGSLLSKLLAEKLIDLPWISMSRAFLGTEQFFYSNKWHMRQVPPERTDPGSGIEYDRDVVRIPRKELGAFQVGADGVGMVAYDEVEDATLAGHATPAPFVAPPAAERLIVATEGLNLRKSPNGTIISGLTIGEQLIDLGADAVDDWRKVRVGEVEGVCFGKYLRKPGRPEVEMLLRATIDEWLRFRKGAGDEKVAPYKGYVREMWAAIGEPYDGASHYPNGEEVPWSAAFISWVVRRAGPAYANFRFSSGHSVFVNNAIKSRVIGNKDKPFWGYRITEAKPEIGDIIHRNRGTHNYSFSYAENHAEYSSHSDIVVEVTPDAVRVIGGNVSDTVSYSTGLKEYHLTADGYLKDDQKIISLLKNRTGLQV